MTNDIMSLCEIFNVVYSFFGFHLENYMEIEMKIEVTCSKVRSYFCYLI